MSLRKTVLILFTGTEKSMTWDHTCYSFPWDYKSYIIWIQSMFKEAKWCAPQCQKIYLPTCPQQRSVQSDQNLHWVQFRLPSFLCRQQTQQADLSLCSVHMSEGMFSHVAPRMILRTIATDKRGYPHNIFLISPQKHMLWVLVRSASARRF